MPHMPRPASSRPFYALPPQSDDAARSDPARDQASATSAIKILLVEDEADLLALAARFLEELGYRVLRAANGPAAIAVAAREPRIDLLLTDMVMPGGISGRQLAAELRARRPGLSVLFMSGYSNDLREHEASVDESIIVMKPYDRQRLAVAVSEALGSIGRASLER